MKANATGRKADYSKIKRKLYSYVFIAVLMAVAAVLLLRQLMRGVAGDWIVRFLMRSYSFDYQDAVTVYHYTIRNNIDILLYITIALCFFFLCNTVLSRFMRYFDEINSGIDSLTHGEGKEIELSHEMAFMEQKLNTLKQTLEHRQQEAKLAEQRKNDLVMYLAHDIKTPLTSVIGYLSLLDEAPDMPMPQRAKYVRITLEKANRLEELIDEFFEITRYNLQTIPLSRASIDLYYMLAQMTDEFFPLLTAKGKHADLQVPENTTIYGDPDKLARVFNNVLKNAAAYSPDNSVIQITSAVSGRMSVITFSNKGSIPKDQLISIFDKFYRLDSARSAATGGSGLGLAIAKEIVLAHGGEIYARSDGEQTSFVVELPIKLVEPLLEEKR